MLTNQNILTHAVPNLFSNFLDCLFGHSVNNQTMTAQHQHTLFRYCGFIYFTEKTSKDYIYLKCTHFNCSAQAKITSDKFLVSSRSGDHTHNSKGNIVILFIIKLSSSHAESM